MDRTCSILVLNYNAEELLARCLPSVVGAAAHGGAKHQVIVVDNASTDSSVEFVRECYPSVVVKKMPENKFLFAYNEAVRECSHDYILLLNNDIIVERDFISPLLRHFDDPSVFAVMPQINAATPQVAYTCRRTAAFCRGRLLAPKDESISSAAYTLYAHGGAAIYDKKKFLELGGLDALFWPLYGEDDDLSYLAWMSGYTILFEPAGKVFHLGGVSTAKFFESESRKRAARERAAMIVILKNIADRQMLTSFLLFSLARVLKAVITLDCPSLNAFWETFLRLPKILRARTEAQARRNLSDREIFRRIGANLMTGSCVGME